MQATYKANPLAKNLPDAYKKTKDSNNYKILEIERIACTDLRKTLGEIDNILDINNATGETLDLYGERVGQARGKANDAKYLLMIKARISRNIANGSYQSIVSALCNTFDCDPSQILIEDGESTCTVNIIQMPLEIINKAGLSTAQTLEIIKSMVPTGVTVDTYLFEGTFEFSELENEYDEKAGFSDVEGGTIGGFLGVTGNDLSDELLPI